MAKKRKILMFLLTILISIAIVVILIIIINKDNNYLKEDEINKIAKIFEINSYYYDEEMDFSNEISILDIENITLNKLISSYAITNIVSNLNYNYDTCRKCYKYFYAEDNIKFYNKEDIESIYSNVFGKNIKRITQEDIIDFNILYYNEEIDMYYINISYLNNKPKIISKFKKYNYNDNKLYLYYYYARLDYDDINNKVWIINFKNNYNNLFDYNELLDDNKKIKDINIYENYFDIIRYEFIYNKENKKYVLNKIKML